MNLDPIHFSNRYSENEVSKQLPQLLLEAISMEDEQTIHKLFAEKIDSQILVDALLEAQKQNKIKIVEYMINQAAFNADMRKQAFSATIESYDRNGDNLALELVKKIADPNIKKDAMTSIEKDLSDKANALFKKNLEKQLNTIRQTLQGAILRKQSNNSSEANTASTGTETLKTYLNILKGIFSDKEDLRVACAGLENTYLTEICHALANTKKMKKVNEGSNEVVDVILAPHTLYSEMEAIFKGCEGLLSQDLLEHHPLFKYFNMLDKQGVFIATFKSGPNIQDFTDLLLGKHGLELEKANQSDKVNLKIFKNVETFFRCLDIFKKKYEERTGQTIHSDLAYSLSHTSLEQFCEGYIKQYPELAEMDPLAREKYIRLLSVFNIENDVLDLDITLTMSIREKDILQSQSFKPIPANTNTFKREQDGSNEISLAQQNLDKQIQTLNGSALSMVHIKDADGKAQFKAFSSLLDRREVKFVDLGGGYGETNAVLQALQGAGPIVNLLNIEPCTKDNCTESYKEAHKAVGIAMVDVKVQNAQLVSTTDVIHHFQNEKVDCLFASHFFYGVLMGEIYKTSHASLPPTQHPLWKYFSMMRDDGVLVMTLQSGAGARLFRNALLDNHGLNPPSAVADETLSLLSSFGNLATFLRHLEVFKEQYQKATGTTLNIKMHTSVANVPLGDFKIKQDQETNGYILENPYGDRKDPKWLSPFMFDFYGNWFELEFLATLTVNKANTIIAEYQANTEGESQKKSSTLSIEEYKELKRKYEILKTKNFLNPSVESLVKQQKSAQEMQQTFLHILRVFALGEKNMQHPNITLEVTKIVSKNH